MKQRTQEKDSTCRYRITRCSGSMLITALVLVLLRQANAQTFNCTLFGGKNELISQSKFCSCPADSYFCGADFARRCVSKQTIADLCSHPVLAAGNNCKSPETDEVCDKNANSQYILATINNVKYCIRKILACACPSHLLPCNNLFTSTNPSAFASCFSLDKYKSSCKVGACTNTQYHCGGGTCLDSGIPCVTVTGSCSGSPCGAEFQNQGCPATSKSCPFCANHTIFSSLHCKKTGCTSSEVNCSSLATGYCINSKALCGPCADGYANCPNTANQLCVDPDEECAKCSFSGNKCTAAPSSGKCDSKSTIQCGKVCLPLTEACNVPSVCAVHCGTNYQSACITQAAVNSFCAKCSDTSKANCLKPMTINSKRVCPEGTVLCQTGSNYYCAYKESVCGCRLHETACSATTGYRCVNTSIINDACKVTTKTTTTKSTTKTTTTTTTTTRLIIGPIKKQNDLIIAPVVIMGVLSTVAIIISAVLSALAARATKRGDSEDKSILTYVIVPD